MYCILKHVKKDDIYLPVVMMTLGEEIWEFEDIKSAQEMADILELNSDSGHKYSVKKI